MLGLTDKGNLFRRGVYMAPGHLGEGGSKSNRGRARIRDGGAIDSGSHRTLWTKKRRFWPGRS